MGCEYKDLVFCRNNGLIMENMNKGLTVPKWELKFCQKYAKCPKICLPNLSAQAQKLGISMKKRLHWASVVHGPMQCRYIAGIIPCEYKKWVVAEYYVPHLALLYLTIVWTGCSSQRYTYRVLQTIQMKLIFLCVWAEQAVSRVLGILYNFAVIQSH